MAGKTTSSSGAFGGALGLILSIVLVAGVAASPFYLTSMLSETEQADRGIRDDVEILRRVAMNYDPALSLIGEMEKAVMPADQVEVKAEVKRAVSDNQRLLDLARQADTRINQTTVGSAMARDLLPAGRMRAVISLLEGRVHHNQARLHELEAQREAAAAGRHQNQADELRNRIDTEEQRKPRAAIQRIEERELPPLDSQIESLQGKLRKLEDMIAGRKGELDQYRQVSGEARGQMNLLTTMADQHRLSADSTEFARFNEAYAALSRTAIVAEARAAEVENGALRGQDEASRDGDAVELGLFKLHAQRQALADELAAKQAMREQLNARLEDLNGRVQSINGLIAEWSSARDASDRKASDHRSGSKRHESQAQSDREKALKKYQAARDFAKKAADKASQQQREADAAANSAGVLDRERCALRGGDFNSEISMRFLSAEGNFYVALLRHETMIADGADYTQEALDALTKAKAEYELARKQLQRLRVGAYSGNNMLWQAQLGEASVHLLRSLLVAQQDPSQSLNEQDAAYDLLKQAIEGREQSPLLSSAIETFQFLQQSAQR